MHNHKEIDRAISTILKNRVHAIERKLDEPVNVPGWKNLYVWKNNKTFVGDKGPYNSEIEAKQAADDYISGLMERAQNSLPMRLHVCGRPEFFASDYSHTIQMPWFGK